jgi:type IVB pilus formation R64 PilN family outer membrane protein
MTTSTKNILRLSLIATAVLLTGCATDISKRASDGNASIKESAMIASASIAPKITTAASAIKGSAQRAEAIARSQVEPQIVRRALRPWIGGALVSVNNDDKLPASFYSQRQFIANRRSSDAIALAQWAARVTELTQVPLRIAPDVYTSGTSAPAATPVTQITAIVPSLIPSATSTTAAKPPTATIPRILQQLSGGGNSNAQAVMVDAVDAAFEGSLLGHLDHVTNKLGLAWVYENGTITVSRLLTTVYEIDTLPGKSSYGFRSGSGSSSNAGTSGASKTSASSDSITDGGDLDALGSIERTVKQLVSRVQGSAVSLSDGSGMLVVTTSKEIHSQISSYIKTENAALGKNIQIQFDVYSVITDVTNQRGIDWSVLYNQLGNKYGLNLGSPSSLVDAGAAGFSANVIKAGGAATGDLNKRLGDSKALLQLLHQFGDSARHTPVSLVTQNRNWIDDNQLQTLKYVSETAPGVASSASVASTFSLKTETLTTGDQYQALGFATNSGKVILKYSINFSDLIKLDKFSAGAGDNAQSVQLPKVTSTTSKRQVTLAPGEVMVLTGLSRFVTTQDTRTLTEGAPVALGGSEATTIKREHFAVFVRAMAL